MNLNEENIIQILGEFLVCEGFNHYNELCSIFQCLSDEDNDHIFYDFVLPFLMNEPNHRSLQLIHAFLSNCSSANTYIIELIDQGYYELLITHLQIREFTDIKIKQLVYDKLKEQNTNNYSQIFILQRLYFLLEPNKKECAEQIFSNNLRIIQQIFASISEETLREYLLTQKLLVIYCKDIQQQKLSKLLALIKQQNQSMGLSLSQIISETESIIKGQTSNNIDYPITIVNTKTTLSFRLYYTKQRFMQNLRQINGLIRDLEQEQKDHYKQYAQQQLQL